MHCRNWCRKPKFNISSRKKQNFPVNDYQQKLNAVYFQKDFSRINALSQPFFCSFDGTNIRKTQQNPTQGNVTYWSIFYPLSRQFLLNCSIS